MGQGDAIDIVLPEFFISIVDMWILTLKCNGGQRREYR